MEKTTWLSTLFGSPKKSSKVSPVSQTQNRYHFQRHIQKRMKQWKSQILNHPFDSYVHRQNNALEIHPPFYKSIQQLETLVENQKAMLDWSLKISQCIHSKKEMKSILSKWEDTTRDLFTHFDILHKQQKDLIELQEKDISYLQHYFHSIDPPCIPPQQDQQVWGNRRSLSQVFQESPRQE